MIDDILDYDPDVIGKWSEIKLKIIENYGHAYTVALKNKGLKLIYIDGFSGAGQHLSKENYEIILGSPLRALKYQFKYFHFIDLDKNKALFLRKVCADYLDKVTIYNEDCSECLLNKITPQIKYENYERALCVLDPYNLVLDWKVLNKAGQSKIFDIFLNFPIMDMNRNALRKDRDKVSKSDIDRMNFFWGDNSWQEAAYKEDEQKDLFKDKSTKKQDNNAIVSAFRQRLKEVAGFKFVPEPIAMKNKKNAVVYYLFFASNNQLGNDIASSIFKKYR